jgi:hypothetical protein
MSDAMVCNIENFHVANTNIQFADIDMADPDVPFANTANPNDYFLKF